MSYATISDVINRYPPISTAIGSGTYDVTSVNVNSVFIAGAEGYVDAYLAHRYVTPVSSPSPLITQITADLAIFQIMTERLPNLPDWLNKRYERCQDMLSKIAEGKMLVPGATAVTTGGDNYAWAANMHHHPIFEPSIPIEEQTVDKQRKDEQATERSVDADIA